MRSSRGRRAGAAFASVLALVAIIGSIGLTAPALADDEEDPLAQVTVDLSKTVSKAIVEPGDTITYAIAVNCASTIADCVNLSIADTIPPPFVLGNVALSNASGDEDRAVVVLDRPANSFAVNFIGDLGEGRAGLEAGTLYNFAVTATLPVDPDADFDGKVVTNTASATLDNEYSGKESSATTTLAVPLRLSSTVDKTFSIPAVPSIPARTLAMTLAASNSSNVAVDVLTIDDSTTAAFTYLAVTGAAITSWPTGADTVATNWFNGTTWDYGAATTSIVLPPDPSLVRGLQFVFSGTPGIERDASAVVQVSLALRDNVLDITGEELVANTATSTVTDNGWTPLPVESPATLTITQAAIAPVATKSFSTNSIVGGQPLTITLGASNGGNFDFDRMTITEPATSTPDLAAQGLAFGGFVPAEVEWPVGATGASIRYRFEGEPDFATAIPASTRDTIPEPAIADAGRVIVGFSVTFTGLMREGQYAVVPFVATPAAVVADVTTINTTQVDVRTLGGLEATAPATDTVTTRTARINTSVRKVASPAQIYSIPGASTIIALPGQLDPLPASPSDFGGSTVGAKSLTIADADTDFFDYFDLSRILPTVVPSGVSLEVQYFDGADWVPFASNSTAVGPQSYSRTLSAGERAAAQGIRFIFTPTDPADSLAPGFAVSPNLRVSLRSTLRSDTAVPAANPDAPDVVVLSNTAASTAFSPSTDPSTVESDDTVDVSLLPVPSGPGIGFLGKQWEQDTVVARSGDQATAHIDWGTANLPFDKVGISDSADPSAPVASTVFEAFDLVSIAPITEAMDPRLTYDAVTAVQLFIGGAWVSTTINPCATGACDGTFPGYVLTDDERRDAVGVRLVFEESPTRAQRVGVDPLAPPVGTGVAASAANARRISLVFEVRDVRRSDPSVPVLGSARSALYNAGLADFGVVYNTARFVGTAPDNTSRTSTDGDDILILDEALTVKATKSWTGGPLGTPPAGTPDQLYPTARITATAQNTSLARVDYLALTEPSSRLPINPFEFVNLSDIVGITVPSGPTATVTLQPSGDEYSIVDALALTAWQLEDVTGISVELEGRVNSLSMITLVLDTQLRATARSDGSAILAQQLDNEVEATIIDPGGSQIPTPGPNNVIPDFAPEHVDIEVFTYGVIATKTLIADTTATSGSPATQYANTTAATVRLSGQSTGNVRSTRMVIEDTDASFFNAYNFAGFPAFQFATPINNVQVDVLVGVDYVLGAGNSINWNCPTTNCWVTGTPASTPSLPAGVSAQDVRGIRFTFTRSDYAAWERPFNPKQIVDFTVERRATLIAPTGTPVPSTLFTFTDQAPGESVIGTYNNDATVTVSSALDAQDTAPLWSKTGTDSSAITFQHLPAQVAISKSELGPQSLGVDVPFTLKITNTGEQHDSPLTGVVIVDTLPSDGSGPQMVIGIDDNTGTIFAPSAAFTYSLLNGAGTTVAAPSVTAAYDNPTAPATITFTLNQTLPLGWTLVISAPLQFRPLLGAGIEANNRVVVTADQPFDECRGTVDTIWADPTFFVSDCAASTIVWPLPSSPMTIVKAVRGIEAGPLDSFGDKLIDPNTLDPFDDLGVLRTTGTSDCSVPTTFIPGRADLFYRHPCVPITRPGSEEEWGARFYNSGNISIKQLVAIDVLPTPGDRGVIIDDARSSKWTAKLSSYPELTGVPASTTYTVYYVDQQGIATNQCNGADIQLTMGMTTISNPPILNTPQYRGCLAPDGASLAVPRNWQVLDPSADATTLASVVAMKFDVQLPDTLAPDGSIGILYRTITANQQELKETSPANLYRDSVAYNSIAGAAVGINTDSSGNPIDIAYRFVTEPRKVGVALATGVINLSKAVTGAAASYATDQFNLAMECTSNGETVVLKLANGTSRTPFVVTAGTSLAVYGVPLYSTCSISEVGNYGATTVTNSGATRVLAQLSSGLSSVFDPHPPFAARQTPLTASIVNDYPAASLTVTKTVETNGAVDQDDVAIAYKPALASVSCTFNNGTGVKNVLSKTDEQLIPGTPLVYAGLPAGTLCTVTETDQRGAATTSVITTNAGTVSGGASPTAFALTEGANSVDFANDFGVGSILVTKVVAGLAQAEAWAAGPFTVQVTCTNSNAIASTVYSKAIVLSRTNTTYRIENLATGSSCVTTEPEKNGATSTLISPSSITVSRAEQAQTVTNTFDYARLTVTKIVTTNAVDGSGVAVRPGPFSFAVECTFTHGTAASPVTDIVLATGFTASPMTFSLSHNGSQALTGMPAGTKCVVTEDTPVGSPTTTIRTQTSKVGPTTVTARTATINSLTSDTSATVGTNTARVTNTYPVGTLRITKSLQGGARTQFGTGPFNFTVTCTAPGVADTYVKNIVQATATTTAIPNIIAGSTCSVEETNSATTGADATVIRNNSGVVFDGTGVAVVGNATRTVTFENWYLTGAVTVSKTVTGPGAAFGTGPFTVHLECTRDGKTVTIAGGANRNLTNGTSTQYTLLPSGASCTLTEPGAYGAGTTTISDVGGTYDVNGVFTFIVAVDKDSLVDNQPQPALGVTNRFELAGLTVSKAVVSDAEYEDGSLVTYGSFDVLVTCTFQGVGVKATGFASNAMTFSLADSANRTLEGLPAGAVCTITETGTRGAARTSIAVVAGSAPEVTTDAVAATVTLVQDDVAGATNSAAITNEFDSGSLELSKVVTGLAREQYGTGTFTIGVVCTLVDGATSQVVWTDEFDFVDGSTPVVLSPIATGAACVITESAAAGATSTSVTIDGAVSRGATATAIVPAVTPTEVVVTNTFDYASLVVSKTVVSDAVDQDNDPVYPGGNFRIEVECKFLGVVVLPLGAVTSPTVISLGHDDSETLTGLPAGSTCEIKETDWVQADSTSITTTTTSGTATVDARTATIAYLTSDAGADSTSPTNSAAVANRYGVTSFTVAKVLLGAGSAQFGTGPFEIHVVCTAAGDVVAYDDTISLPIGNDWFKRLENIPNGSVCETEETNFDATGADAQETVDALGNEVTSTTVSLASPGYVAIRNWYLSGALDITKTVTGAGRTDFGAGPFTVTIECVRDLVVVELPVSSQTFTDGQKITFGSLPTGASCTVKETNVAGAHSSEITRASDGSTLTTDVATGYTFTVTTVATSLTDDQDQPALGVTNDFPVTGMTLTKTVTTDAVDETPTPISYGPFAVLVKCEFVGRAVFATGFDIDHPMVTDLVDGVPWELAGLPVGAACEVEETNAMGADATSITATIAGTPTVTTGAVANFTLATDDRNVIDIENTFDVGSVSLSKLVWGDGGDVWGLSSFHLTLECSLTDASGTRDTYSGEWTVYGDDDPIVVSNIAAGSTCVVTEDETGAANATTITAGDADPTEGTTAQFTVPASVIGIEVANQFDVTDIDVTKDRTGGGRELWGAGPFEVTLVCTREVNGETTSVTIPGLATRELKAPGYTASYSGLPVGAACALSETKVGGANGTLVSPGVFQLDADTTEVTVSNVFNVGSLRVTKVVKGDGVDVEQWGTGPFEVSLECTRSVNGASTLITIPGGPTRLISLGAPYTATYDDLPQDAVCVVTETDSGEASSTVIAPSSITILDGDTVDVTVTNTFTIGTLHIVKTASTPVVQADEEFDYTFVASNTGTVPAAGITVVDEIPELLKVVAIDADGWTDCAAADTDVFGYGGTLTCVYDVTLLPGESATAFTITVAVHPDIAVNDIENVAVVSSTTRGVTGDDDDENVKVKWLSVDYSAECVLDASWFDYSVDARNFDTTGETLTVTWRDGSGTVVHVEEIPLDGGAISGRLLWPGSQVNAAGVGIQWPGWRAALPGETPQFENMVLDSTLPEYGLIAHTSVTLSINPSTTVDVEYPRTPACAVDREPGIWITKAASTYVVPAGGAFDYTIEVGNNGLGAVQNLSVVDPIPTSLKVLSVKRGTPVSANVPAWESCEITDRLASGYGGTLTCVLDRPLGYLESVPTLVLRVQLDPSAAQGMITNVATVKGTSIDELVALSADDSAIIMTPGMLALTGLVVGGFVLPLAFGLLALGGILIGLRFTAGARRKKDTRA